MSFPGVLRNQPTVSRGSLLRPYPQYGGNLTANNVGNWRSRYQALQLRVQRTYAAGASVLVAYNYNQERNEAYFNDPQQYVDQPFWLGSNDARHRLTLAGTYDFPVGKGRRFGAGMHPVLNGIVGGWQISGIYTYRSGEFLRFGGADVVGDPYIDNPGPDKWFNTDAFRVQTPFTPRLNPYQYSGVARADLLERGRHHLQDVSDSRALPRRVPLRRLQPDQLADVGQSCHYAWQPAHRALDRSGHDQPRT